MGREEAQGKVARCDEPERYEDCLETIRIVHGYAEKIKTDLLLRKKTDDPIP